MTWPTVRAHYERLFLAAKRERGETQQTIAARGGIRQNDLSRLFQVGGKGPRAETLLRAIAGLGMPVSSFFAQIEGLSPTGQPAQDAPDGPRHPVPRSAADEIGPEARERLTELWLALGTIVAPPRRPATLERPAASDRVGVAGRAKPGRAVRRASSG